MHRAQRILPVLVLLFTSGTAFAQQAIKWEGTLDSAKAAASKSNRLVLVFFTADWCPNCHRLENDLRSQPGAAAALEANFSPVKLNYDYFQKTAQQYGVTRLPTTIILAPTPAGEVLAVIPEAMPVDQYLGRVNSVAAEVRRHNAGAYAQIRSNPVDGPAAARNPLRPAAETMPSDATVKQDSPSFANPRPASDYPGAHNVVAGAGIATLPGAAPASVAQPYSTAAPVAVIRPDIVAAPSAYAPAVSSSPAADNARTAPAPAMPSAPTPVASSARPADTMQPPAPTPIALDGFCPVQLFENGRWQKGNKACGIVHRGRIYLFASEEERRRFAADPDRYAPVNSGNDVVLSLDLGRSVPGFREHGAQFDGHVYLFANEDTLAKFRSNPRYYSQRALQAIRPVMQTAAMR